MAAMAAEPEAPSRLSAIDDMPLRVWHIARLDAGAGVFNFMISFGRGANMDEQEQRYVTVFGTEPDCVTVWFSIVDARGFVRSRMDWEVSRTAEANTGWLVTRDTDTRLAEYHENLFDAHVIDSRGLLAFVQVVMQKLRTDAGARSLYMARMASAALFNVENDNLRSMVNAQIKILDKPVRAVYNPATKTCIPTPAEAARQP